MFPKGVGQSASGYHGTWSLVVVVVVVRLIGLEDRGPAVGSGLVIDVGRPAQSVALSIKSIKTGADDACLDGG